MTQMCKTEGNSGLARLGNKRVGRGRQTDWSKIPVGEKIESIQWDFPENKCSFFNLLHSLYNVVRQQRR